MTIYNLVALGGMILASSSLTSKRADLANAKLSRSNSSLQWMPAGEAPAPRMTAGQKAAETRRLRKLSQAVA